MNVCNFPIFQTFSQMKLTVIISKSFYQDFYGIKNYIEGRKEKQQFIVIIKNGCNTIGLVRALYSNKRIKTRVIYNLQELELLR